MSAYNEEAYENALIELFQNMGWEHVYGPDVGKRCTALSLIIIILVLNFML